jgi:hypothetical protein
LVSDIQAGDGKIVNLFYSVPAPEVQCTERRKTKREGRGAPLMLSQLTREGVKDPNKTTAKSSEVSSCKLPFIRVTLLVKKTNTCRDLKMAAGAFFLFT